MRAVLLLFIIIPLLVNAQKKIRPNVNKAEKAFQSGKLDEAKAIIDVTVQDDKFLFNPKAWYLRGVIYTSIDTTTNTAYKKLNPDPFAEAISSFDKYKSLIAQNYPKPSVFLASRTGIPLLPEQINGQFAQAYFDKGLSFYQGKKMYKDALENIEKTIYFIPNDTSVLLNAGLFFAPSAEEHEKTLDFLRAYIDNGGKSPDAYTMMFSVYRDKLKDDEKALSIAQEAIETFPKNDDFPNYELDIYMRMGKLEEAREGLKKSFEKEEPSNAKTAYYIGAICQDLKEYPQAMEWYKKSIAIDDNYFEPRTALAELVYMDVKKVKREANSLGITKADNKRRMELDKIMVEKLKTSLVYWENCEKIKGDDINVLDHLYNIYRDLGMDEEAKRVQAKR